MILFAFVGVWANAQVPDGFVSYDQRPDILKAAPKDHSSLPKSWEALKRGHLEAVAQVLELYPKHEIYFLARDSELLYDFAKLATQDEPTYAKRIHLLNVSQANMKAEHIKDYLAQEGISENTLKSGKKILFVDTGFLGTIPRVIEDYFPEELRHLFQTHLLSSSNSSHPSTRVFLQSLNPAATEVYPSSLRGSIIEYEEMPRFTDRSDRFAQVNGKWVPISPAHSASDGKVDQTAAREYQESLAAYQKSREGKKLFKERRKIYRKLRQLQDHPDQLKKELQTLLSQGTQDPSTLALVMDFLEIEATHYGHQKVLPKDLGIEWSTSSGIITLSNKNDLIQKYPEWAWVLEDPETGISKLLKEQDYTTLGAINDVIQNHEYFTIFAQAMGELQPTAKDAALVDALIKNGKADRAIAQYVLSKPHWARHPELVEALIKSGKVDKEIAEYVLSRFYWGDHPELVETLIKNGTVDMAIAQSVLSQPHWANHPEWVEALIKNGEADRHIAMYVLSQPYWANHPKLLEALIKNGKANEEIAKFVLSRPHWKNYRGVKIDGTQSGNPCQIKQFLEPMFIRPTEHMQMQYIDSIKFPQIYEPLKF